MNGSQISSESVRPFWTQTEVLALHELPFNDLLFRAHGVHRENFDPNKVNSAGSSASRQAAARRIAAIAASLRITKAV